MAAQVADLLKARQQTVAVSESSAGGLISAALLAVPGASAYFLGGGVIYTREARRILLDIPDDAVRHTVPLLMACGARLPERLEWLREAIAEYIEEEIGHQEWILNDIRACGEIAQVDILHHLGTGEAE